MTTMLKERKAKEGSLSSTSETGPSSGGSGMNVGSIPSTGEDSFDNRSSLLESPSIDQSSQVAPAPEEPGRRDVCSIVNATMSQPPLQSKTGSSSSGVRLGFSEDHLMTITSSGQDQTQVDRIDKKGEDEDDHCDWNKKNTSFLSQKRKRKTIFTRKTSNSNLIGTRYCASINCNNNRAANSNLAFFRFPKNHERCQRWIQNSRRTDLNKKSSIYCYNNLLLCTKHFEDQMFCNAEKRRLNENAIPTIFEVPHPAKLVANKRRTLGRHIDSPSPSSVAPMSPSLTSNLPAADPLASNPPAADPPAPDPPAIDPPATDPPEPQPSSSVLAGKAKEESKATPMKGKLRLKLKKLQNALRNRNVAIKRLQKELEKSRKIDAVTEAMKPFLTPHEHEIVAMQMRLSLGSRKRYSEEFKSFAVSIYVKSPSCYRLLKTRFKLPALSSIRLWLSQLQFRTGLCTNLLKMLTIRVQRLSPEERICSLICDQISLREAVDHSGGEHGELEVEDTGYYSSAVVFMAAGLRSKWKQAVAYEFIKNLVQVEDLRNITMKILSEMLNIGLNVVALTSDQSSDLHSLKTVVGGTPSQPYFEFKGRKIFLVDDISGLMRSARDCLMENFIEWPKTPESTGFHRASWSHIAQFYERDRKQEIRLAPKLTDGHFDLKACGSKMDVRKAVQVLSHSVAAGLHTYVQFGLLGPEAADTAVFVDWMNTLFDTLNSSKKKDSTVFKSACTPESSELLNFLDNTSAWLNSWRIRSIDTERDVTNAFKFIPGLRRDVEVVKQMTSELIREQRKLSFLCTRRLSSDPMGNLFSEIRGRHGFHPSPSSLEFAQAFKQSLMN